MTSRKAVLNGKPIHVIVRREEVPWTPELILEMARLRDNESEYVLCRTKRSVRDIERLFRQREVACLLEESVGGIVGGFDLSEPGFLYMQIDRTIADNDELLDVCLEEVGVKIIRQHEPVSEEKELEDDNDGS